jgi:DNA-binding NarL/FixJ family response regulator
MKSTKIQIAIADCNSENIKAIKAAFFDLPQYEIIITAIGGKNLIEQLNELKKMPQLILLNLQLCCCDAIATTTICRNLFGNSFKIIGISNNPKSSIISKFIAEGGNGYLCDLMFQKFAAAAIYKDSNCFKNVIHQIINETENYFDPLCDYNAIQSFSIKSTSEIISQINLKLTIQQIKYLQLNAAGFSQEKIAKMMFLTPVSIKVYSSVLCKKFNAENQKDLINISINLGIVILANLYQDKE